MGDFGEAERRILGFMLEGTEFVFEGKEYAVVYLGNQHVVKENLKQTFIFWQNQMRVILKLKFLIRKKMLILLKIR